MRMNGIPLHCFYISSATCIDQFADWRVVHCRLKVEGDVLSISVQRETSKDEEKEEGGVKCVSCPLFDFTRCLTYSYRYHGFGQSISYSTYLTSFDGLKPISCSMPISALLQILLLLCVYRYT